MTNCSSFLALLGPNIQSNATWYTKNIAIGSNSSKNS